VADPCTVSGLRCRLQRVDATLVRTKSSQLNIHCVTDDPPVTTAAPTSTSVVTTSANPSTSSTPSIDSAIAVYAACTMPAAQQHPTVEPAAIDMACADNGFGVKDVHWTRWTAGSATGAGTTWYKDCRPNCAEGKIIYTPGVQVTLTRPVRGASGGLVWSQITLSTLPPGYSPGPQALPTHPI
jgi:hypothetical protein